LAAAAAAAGHQVPGIPVLAETVLVVPCSSSQLSKQPTNYQP
jgi:hypothetical protein